MERTVRTQRSLSKQEEIDEGDEVDCYENGKSGSDCSSSSEGKADDPLPTTPNNNNNNNNNNNVLHRSRSQSKVKLLVRSHAVREETSPPPEAVSSSSPPPNSPPHHHQPASAPPQGLRVRHKLRREGSSQGSTDSWEPTLSRGNSREQYEGSNSSTVDLQQFIVETLNRNYKDRMLLLKIETELLSLAKDPKRTAHKFGQMSSYQRMLVHRVAAYFGMEHNVDPSGASVIVNTTKATRVPERRFKEFVRTDLQQPLPPQQQSPPSSAAATSALPSLPLAQSRPKYVHTWDDLLLPEEPRKSILKRDSSSFDETGCFKSGDRMLNGESRRSKSFEEREEEYEKARRRIFNREHSGDGGEVECMDELHWEAESGLCTQCDRAQTHTIDRGVRLLKVESYECGDTLRANSLRLSVSKSHSFNGYDPPHNTRILTKQDSGSSMSSRISPSSSGYKSQRSDATLSATPSPTATPNLHTQLSGQSGVVSPEPQDTPVVWAVTDMASVPPGSVLIHPQTGQPYTNPDGTIYHFDPSNPPRVVENSGGGGGGGGGGETRGGGGGGKQGGGGGGGSSGDCIVEGDVSRGSSQEKTVPHYEAAVPQVPQDTRLCPSQYCHTTSTHSMGGSGGYGGVSYANNGGQSYSMMAAPAQDPAAAYHPLICQNYLPHQYDPRIPTENSQNTGELAAYMMGLSLDGRPEPRPQPLYWQSHHIQGGNGGSQSAVPVYYTTGGTRGGGGYQATAFAAPQLPPPPWS